MVKKITVLFFAVLLLPLVGKVYAQTPSSVLFSDDFDGNLSAYQQLGGTWSTVSHSGRGSVLRFTSNAATIIYLSGGDFSGGYEVRAEIWNEDNDEAGLAFRVNTADGDNFYSCSATADNGFNAGLWRHVNDLSRTPTSALAVTPWTYVRQRWYTVTVTVDQGTIGCTWESQESGVELDVTAVDPNPSEGGSVGIWLSSQDNFRGDLLEVVTLGPPDTEPPVINVAQPTGTDYDTSSVELIYTATDDVGLSECSYKLDGGISTVLPSCQNTTLTSLTLGDHEVQVFATDTSNNTSQSPPINFTVNKDTTPPQWNPAPENQSLVEGQILSYQVNAIDNVGVISYSIDDTSNFTIDSLTGLIGNNVSLPTSTYSLNISVQDITGNVNTAAITISVVPEPPPVYYFDDFDSNNLSGYQQLGGTWTTVSQSGRGSVLRHTGNSRTIIFPQGENFTDSYEVRAEIWNEDNDEAGLAFRVNTADGDNFYSCSATADNRFNAGLWRHVNDRSGTPTSALAVTSWTYVRQRWYTVTVAVDQGVINCIWESQESGVELDVTAVDPNPSETDWCCSMCPSQIPAPHGPQV